MDDLATYKVVNLEDEAFSASASTLRAIVATLPCPLWVVLDFDTWEFLHAETQPGAVELLKNDWHVISRNQLLSALEEVSIIYSIFAAGLREEVPPAELSCDVLMQVAQVTVALSQARSWYVLTDSCTIASIVAALPGAVAERHSAHIREELPR